MGVRAGQARLKKLADQIINGIELAPHDMEFLGTALHNISNGENAEDALGVKAKKGERKGKRSRDNKMIKKEVNQLLGALIAPECEEGLALSLKDAVSLVKRCCLPILPSEATLRRNWNDFRKTHERDFVSETD